MKHNPPKWADRFLEWYCNPALLEEIRGDVYELYRRNVQQFSKIEADLRFIWSIVRFFRWSNIKRTGTGSYGLGTMLYQNYFRVFKRNLVNQKGFSFLNVAGLSVGIACFLFISFYVRDEFSYDKYHSKADRIYRIHEIFESDGVGERSASLPFPVADALLNDYQPKVSKVVRLFNFQAPSLAISTIDQKKEFNEQRLFFADSTLFDVFDFKLIKGDKKTALQNPNSILLTKSSAKKYFQGEEAVGKYLKFQGNTDLLVTGILEDTPPNSHFQFDFLVSFSTLRQFYNGHYPRSWYWNPCWTYVLLESPDDLNTLQSAMPGFIRKYFPDFIKDDLRIEFMPLADIHLESHLDYEIQPNGSKSTIYIFSCIAIFVLAIACINFINLSTAQATRRSKEVGMRKAFGGIKGQLMTQFLLESVGLCTIAVGIAIVSVVVLLPYFNLMADKEIKATIILEPVFLYSILLLPLIVGILSGIYPALVMSRFKPIIAINGGQGQERRGSFRTALVVVQFSLSIVLLVGTGVVIDQLTLLRESDTGFEQENVIMIPVSRSPIARNFETLKNEFLRHPGALGVTAVEEVLGSKHQVANYQFEGMEASKPFPHLNIRYDFARTFGLEIVAGRDFSEDIPSDDSLALVVNEQLVKQMGWASNEEAIGKRFTERGSDRRIVGVVKDFNFTSLHQPIGPLVLNLNMDPRAFDLFIKYMSVRISPENVEETLKWLQAKWEQQMPGWPFEYFFLKNNLSKLYESETRLGKVTTIFSGLSILVACLGLFGLSAYTADLRKKEMSIRKVLGSSVGEIFILFAQRFFKLIFVSMLIAFPLAYALLNEWLSSFAYRTSIKPMVFVTGAFVALAIAFLTICYQGFRTANVNPADTLKNN